MLGKSVERTDVEVRTLGVRVSWCTNNNMISTTRLVSARAGNVAL